MDLGRELFDDRRLSSDGTVSCATCHQASLAFTDGKATAVGAGGMVGDRNSPQIFNLAGASPLLWDGRAASLDEVVKLALTNPREMGMTGPGVAAALAPERGRFQRVLGRPPDLDSVGEAVAAYLLTFRSGGSRVDRYLYCGDGSALTSADRRGLELCAGRANCVRCHVFEHESVHPFGGRRALFTDHRFHNIGAGRGADPGRAGVTGRPEDHGAFKTPTLRNVALTAPYMHDGSLSTLAEVVEFYDRGGVPNANLDRNIVPLGLDDADKQAIVAYLRALTGEEMEGTGGDAPDTVPVGTMEGGN